MSPLSVSHSSVPPFLIEIPLKEIPIIRQGFSQIVTGQDSAHFINSLCKNYVDESFVRVIQKIITSGGSYEQVPPTLFNYKREQSMVEK